MQIKAVSKETGLTIKTIRFYVERGLVTPKEEWKNGKTYREYRPEDVERLNMIAVLRKCLFSIDQIKTMIDYPELTPDVFTQYRAAIGTQRDLLKILAEKAETLDPETLDGPEVLARRLSFTAAPLPLPATDMDPHFGKMDPETPEQRQAAFVKWQKRYPYRHIRRWALPVLTLVLLLIATLVQANMWKNGNVSYFLEQTQDFYETPMEYTVNIPEPFYSQGYGVTYDRACSMVYGLYDTEGTLLPYPGKIPNGIPNGTTSEIIVADIITDYRHGAIALEKPRLQTAMEDWMETRQGDSVMIRSSILSQSMATAQEVEVQGEAFTLVFYFEQHPLGYVMGKVWPWFVGLGLFWLLVFAFLTSQGYHFKVNYFRTFGPRGTWTGGIISVDEDTGAATMLTSGSAGSGNLVETNPRD